MNRYFQIQYKPSTKKSYFIYSPESSSAWFDKEVLPTDTFIVSRLGIKLFYRKDSSNKNHLPDIPSIGSLHYGIPLLKSNLQKAVRRKNVVVAITSAIAIMHINIVELIRRIPIIMVEDVCVSAYLLPIVWMLVADKLYVPTLRDRWLLLEAVYDTCICDTVYEYAMAPLSPTITEPYSVNCILTKYADIDNLDILMSIHLRSLYGGMSCDMVMLNNTIEYYANEQPPIGDIQPAEQIRDIILLHCQDRLSVMLLEVGIDFHPFPKLLKILSKITELDEETIRKTIWLTESAYNVRKPKTIQISDEYAQTEQWQLIRRSLGWARTQMVAPIHTN